MTSRAPKTQCQMLECLESHCFSGALFLAPPFSGRKLVGGAHRRGPGMAGGGRRKECGSVSRQAGFSGEALDWSLGVAAPDYLK